MASRKKTQIKLPPKDQSRAGSRKHTVWFVVCNDGPLDDSKVRQDIYPWHEKERPETRGLLPAVHFEEGVGGEYVLAWDDDPKKVTYEWEEIS